MCSAFGKRVHVVIGIADITAQRTEDEQRQYAERCPELREPHCLHTADSFALLYFQHGGERRVNQKPKEHPNITGHVFSPMP